MATEPETTDPTNPYLDDQGGVEDFDAFFTAHRAKRKPRTTTIMGERVTLPASLPLQFELEARKLARSKRDQDVRKLVGILFGPDALDGWTKAGMDLEQFSVLLAWAPQIIAGEQVTLAEVAAQLAEAEAKQGDQDDEQDAAADPS